MNPGKTHSVCQPDSFVLVIARALMLMVDDDHGRLFPPLFVAAGEDHCSPPHLTRDLREAYESKLEAPPPLASL